MAVCISCSLPAQAGPQKQRQTCLAWVWHICVNTQATKQAAFAGLQLLLKGDKMPRLDLGPCPSLHWVALDSESIQELDLR